MNTANVNIRKSTLSAWALEAKIGLVLFVAVLAFYIIKAPTFAVPGRWAGILASFSGLDPFRPVIRPIWSFFMILLSALPLPNLALSVHILSAVLGAGVCWLMFEIVRRVPFSRSFHRKNRNTFERYPRLVAGLFAGLFAAVSLPMIIVSTRGDFSVLEMFVMLLPFYPLMKFRETKQLLHFPLSCFLFGLALIEYPHMTLIFPGFAIWWFLLLWKSSWLKISTILFALMLMVSGLLVVLAFAHYYSTTEAAMVRNLTGTPDILKEYIRLYVGELTDGVPKVGWLLILAMNIVPFFLVMLRELDEPTDRFSAIGVYAFRLLLFCIAVFVLFRLPGSPDHAIGSRILLIAPTLMVAIWSGFLVGYYYGLLLDRQRRKGAAGLLAVCAIMLGVAGFRHNAEARTSHLIPTAAFADEIIRNLEGRGFILTDGSLDASLKLSARRQGVRVNLINVAAGQSVEYGRYFAGMFSNADMQNLASMGSRTLLRGWFHRDPTAAEQVAILVNPDIVETPGFRIVPDRAFYHLVGETPPVDPDAMVQRVESDWAARIMPDLSGMEPADSGWFQGQFVIRWSSRLANDLGVLLDEAGQEDVAAEFYQQALRFWPENISAMLNLREQARRRNAEDLEILEAQLKTQIEKNPALFNLPFLHQFCGQVRNPLAMMERASLLARAGQSPQAMAKLESAGDLIDEEDSGARLSLARLYLQGGNLDEGETIYRQMLAANPQSLDAHYGLFRVAMARKNLDEAARLLEVMEALGAEPKQLMMDRADILLARGNVDEAKRMFLAMSREDNAPTEVWFALAQIGIRQKDDDLIQAAFGMLARDRNYVPGMFLLGERAMLQKRPEEARDYFSRVVALDPAHEAALVRLIQLDFDEKNVAALRVHSSALLNIQPDHAFGNFMSAFVHVDAERYDLAEAALRRSLAAREFPPALNELAWVLFKLDRSAEGLPFARKAIEMAPENPSFWDTLAVIQSTLGTDDDARVSIQKALELDRHGQPAIAIHAAEIFIKGDQHQLAEEQLERLPAMVEILTPEQWKKVDELQKQLKR